ncbi:hypothetical protein AZI86_01655 [Bdellovibrio bacteriovorus]|uniref:Bdellovibrio beta-sandwich domain-containing protein n=1 Tax=Bdellovibrio bacteriovorus TaxID=959 RepID=A0A150WN51_BDEBC|nr:hypothetical protein [Bdellovibrio bacteriovorus]KYG65804.1 hypothetical protein AZI86_01655 [Bdellovibrio bacteriovorus]
MKKTVLTALSLFLTSICIAHADASAPIDYNSLQGKQIKILSIVEANKLFEEKQSPPADEQLVLADGKIQALKVAEASGTAVICSFTGIKVYQNGYFPFSAESRLEVVKVDAASMPSLKLLQLNFTVHHDNFHVGREHQDRQFNCFNQVGTIFSRESLDIAFGNILTIEQ